MIDKDKITKVLLKLNIMSIFFDSDWFDYGKNYYHKKNVICIVIVNVMFFMILCLYWFNQKKIEKKH